MRKNRTVLVVDDEPLVLRSTATLLRVSGFDVLTAPDAEGAEAICREHLGPIHVVVMDLILGRAHGLDAVPHLCRVRPELSVLYVTGQPREALGAKLPSPILFKPFTARQLTEAVSKLTDLIT